MSIKEYIEKMKAERGDTSFAFLAERCETSTENPYRIRPASPLKPDEIAVIVLCGAGDNGHDHIREYNGYLKQVDEFVKSSPKLANKKTRVLVAICNFGKYHNPKLARHLQILESWSPDDFRKETAKLKANEREEILNPAYIRDIFNLTVLPRITTKDGLRRGLTRSLGHIRRNTFVTHCHGGYVALCLEKMLDKSMTKLGFDINEKEQIISQFASLNYSPNCPKMAAKSPFISVQSASDYNIQDKSFFDEWLLMKGKDFGVCYLPQKRGNSLICAKIDKSGIEGNPPKVWIAKEIGEFLDERALAIAESQKDDWREPEDEKIADEHSFLGFTPKNNMSKGALTMQTFANNILENTILNSHQQSLYQAIPLPSVQHLAANNFGERAEFAKAQLKGYKLMVESTFMNTNKVCQHKAWRVNHTIEL